jgi:hypothetical protein
VVDVLTFTLINLHTEMSSSQLDDIYEEQRNHKLAEILGISYDEVVELDPEVHERTSNDGVLYGFYIEFDENSPKHIVDKISGVDSTGTLYIDANAFDEPDDDDY